MEIKLISSIGLTNYLKTEATNKYDSRFSCHAETRQILKIFPTSNFPIFSTILVQQGFRGDDCVELFEYILRQELFQILLILRKTQIGPT